MPLSAQDVRRKFRRFRILVVGRANAGKTALLQKVCNTTENPEIFDGKGRKVNPTFHVTSELPTDRSRSDRCRCREMLRQSMYTRTIGMFLTNSGLLPAWGTRHNF
jgi:septin family protein